MDKDRVEGKVKDVAGRAQRQVGEWTGDQSSGEGCRQQVDSPECLGASENERKMQ